MVSALSAEMRKSRICVSKPLLALFPVVFCELFRDVFYMVFRMRARIADNFSTMFSTILMQGGVQFVPPPDFRSTLSDFFENFSGCFSGNLSKKSRPPGRPYTIHLSTTHHTLHHSLIFQKLIVIADVVGGGVMLAGEAEEDGARREIIQVTPNTRDYI